MRKSEGRFGAQRKRRGWENKCSGELIPCPFRTWEKVVLVDLDIGMGNVHLLLGLTPRHTIADLFEHHLSVRRSLKKAQAALIILVVITVFSLC